MRTIAPKLFTRNTVTHTVVAAILCIWVLHKYPFSTPIHEVDVHGGYYTNSNVGTKTRKIRGPYILTMEFAGQQGAGTYMHWSHSSVLSVTWVSLLTLWNHLSSTQYSVIHIQIHMTEILT